MAAISGVARFFLIKLIRIVFQSEKKKNSNAALMPVGSPERF